VLFLLYINDLPLSSIFFCNSFADVTALLISDTDPTNLEKKTDIELNSVFNWLQKNKLTLNLSKTKTILFNNHNRLVTLNINCNNVPLEQVNSTKYLGTIVNSNLTWKEQIASVETKVAQGCYALFKFQPISDVKILWKVYFSLIYPHLQYAILTWGKVPATYLAHLKALHNRSIRCICKISRAAHIPMLDLYHSCKIFQINQIYEYELGKFMYKIVHNCLPSFISNCYSHINERHNYPTRIATNNNLTTTSSKNFLTRRSIQYTGPRLWKNIPKDVRNKSFLAFCPTYKKYLLDLFVLSYIYLQGSNYLNFYLYAPV